MLSQHTVQGITVVIAMPVIKGEDLWLLHNIEFSAVGSWLFSGMEWLLEWSTGLTQNILIHSVTWL